MHADRHYETGYQALLGEYQDDDDHEDGPLSSDVHVFPENLDKSRWSHIKNLDEFFKRVYQYHQRNGILCMSLEDFLSIVQFVGVLWLATFLYACVDYQVLFFEGNYNASHKVTIGEGIIPFGKCISGWPWWLWIVQVLGVLIVVFRLLKLCYNIVQYKEISDFYTKALEIPKEEMVNTTWHEVQRRLMEVQKEVQICIHTKALSQLDIYHRILRFKNYEVAMVNQSLLPLKYHVPLIGDYWIMTSGLMYNLQMLLFWGPWAPFQDHWHLKAEYKSAAKQAELAHDLSQKILLAGIVNLALFPLILLWQFLYSFFRYADSIRNQPAVFALRRWSQYSHLMLRHFNELDHEFQARLTRAYRPARQYMSMFNTPWLAILAKHIRFFAAALLGVLFILTFIDKDFLDVEHIVQSMVILGAIAHVCHACIPDENMVWCPELLMNAILSHIHYMPDHWKGKAHTTKVRAEFSNFFQYQFVYLLENVLSPIITPIILIFYVRPKALNIVKFFRDFTVNVEGVGDVCSFAQMDVRKHGNKDWELDGEGANSTERCENGKTELSLMHFNYTNPEWQPKSPRSAAFLTGLRQRVTQDTAAATVMSTYDNPLAQSLNSLTGGGGIEQYQSMMISSMLGVATQGFSHPTTPTSTSRPSSQQGGGSSTVVNRRPQLPAIRGGLRSMEGPAGGLHPSVMASMHSNAAAVGKRLSAADENTLEMLSHEMCFSALFMHNLHHQRLEQRFHGADAYAEIPGGATGGAEYNSGPDSSSRYQQTSQMTLDLDEKYEHDYLSNELSNSSIRPFYSAEGDLLGPDVSLAPLSLPSSLVQYGSIKRSKVPLAQEQLYTDDIKRRAEEMKLTFGLSSSIYSDCRSSLAGPDSIMEASQVSSTASLDSDPGALGFTPRSATEEHPHAAARRQKQQLQQEAEAEADAQQQQQYQQQRREAALAQLMGSPPQAGGLFPSSPPDGAQAAAGAGASASLREMSDDSPRFTIGSPPRQADDVVVHAGQMKADDVVLQSGSKVTSGFELRSPPGHLSGSGLTGSSGSQRSGHSGGSTGSPRNLFGSSPGGSVGLFDSGSSPRPLGPAGRIGSHADKLPLIFKSSQDDES